MVDSTRLPRNDTKLLDRMQTLDGNYSVTSAPPYSSSMNCGTDASLTTSNANRPADAQNAFVAWPAETKTCLGGWQNTDNMLEVDAFFLDACHHGSFEGSPGQASNSIPQFTPARQLPVFPHFSTDEGTTTHESGAAQIRRSSGEWEDDIPPVPSQSNEHSRAG